MKSNDELLKEFERRRKFNVKEQMDYISNQSLNESEETQVLEVDNIFEYMKSLGYSTLEEISKKYNI